MPEPITVPTSNSTQTRLVRGLGQFDATMIVVGILIGSGIFIVSAESARLVGAPGWLLAAWVLAGVMTVAGSQCCAELAAMLPRAGGQYVYLREAYGPAVGFLFGWALFVVIQTGKIAAVAVAFASFTGVLVGWVSPTAFIVEPIAFGALRDHALDPAARRRAVDPRVDRRERVRSRELASSFRTRSR